MTPRPPISTLFPYTTLFRSRARRRDQVRHELGADRDPRLVLTILARVTEVRQHRGDARRARPSRSKSTRLNSSHITNSYAVFCLKKKNPPSGDQRRNIQSPP